jgi:autotransporter-associated beta strand protein
LSGGTLAATGALGPPISLDAEGGKVEVGAGDLALSGTVSGAGVLTKIGAGTLTLSGENTSVGTVVQNGRLVAARANALPNGGLLTIGSGASVVLQSGLNADVREARVSVAVAPVPEPGTVVLLLAAVALLAWGWCLSGRGQVET